MKCFYCKSDIENGLTTHVVELNNCIVIIKNVPCFKCTQCGEVSLSGTTLEKIEKIIDKCENIMTEIAVINYNDAAA